MKTFKEIRAPKIKKGLRDKKGKLHTVDMKLDGSKLSFKVTDEFGSFKTVNAKGLAKMFEETVIDQITKEGLDEASDPKVAKAVQGLNDLGNKMKGQDAKQVKRIEALFRKGNKKVMQGALRAMDTDLRDQIQDVLEPQGFWKNGVVDF